MPAARVERDGVTAWDFLLDGRLRFDLRVTVILSPGLGLIVWLPYAQPVQDGYRRTYQQLLQWNDELPFVKFGLDPDQRLTLAVEIPADAASGRALGLAIARILAVCDHLLPASARWLWPDGVARVRDPARTSRGESLLRRYDAELAELLPAPATLGPGGTGGGQEPPDQLEAGGS